MMKTSIAVIMAGGKSSRMQQDKALLPFGEASSLAEFQYKRLNKLFSEVYISAKSNKFDFSVKIIEDRYMTSSPLVALVSIFETLELNEVFVLSVDSPFVTEKVIQELYAQGREEADVVIAESNQGFEPLCAIYRRSFLKSAYEALNLNNHRLQALFDSLNIISVKIENKDVFLNLNYPSEYEEAKLKLG